MFGLRRNPFDIRQPPKYGDESWCFVNLELEDGEFLYQKVKKFVERIVNGNPGIRGVFIVGEYGSGKTHVLREILGEAGKMGLKTEEFHGKLIVRKRKMKSEGLLKIIFGEEDVDKIVEMLCKERKVIGIDEAQFFLQLSDEEFLEFMENFRVLVEKLSENKANAGIILCLLPATFSVIKERRPDLLDRFEVIKFRGDLRLEEGINLVKEYLKTARTNHLSNSEKEWLEKAEDKELWPFTVDAIRKIIEIWKIEEIRTVRRFIELCGKVLEYAEENRLMLIKQKDVENCLIKYLDLWKSCIEEWKHTSNKHRLLLHGLYKTIERAINSSHDHTQVIGSVEFAFPEYEIEIEDKKLRVDILVEGAKSIAIEVETSSLNRNRYENLAKCIKDGEINGILVVCTDKKMITKVKKMLGKVGIRNFEIALLEAKENDLKSSLSIGRILAFAFEDYDQKSLKIVNIRELRKVINDDEAINALKVSKIGEKMKTLISEEKKKEEVE